MAIDIREALEGEEESLESIEIRALLRKWNDRKVPLNAQICLIMGVGLFLVEGGIRTGHKDEVLVALEDAKKVKTIAMAAWERAREEQAGPQ